eukprot:225926-Amphidinium_carterae.1
MVLLRVLPEVNTCQLNGGSMCTPAKSWAGKRVWGNHESTMLSVQPNDMSKCVSIHAPYVALLL